MNASTTQLPPNNETPRTLKSDIVSLTERIKDTARDHREAAYVLGGVAAMSLSLAGGVSQNYETIDSSADVVGKYGTPTGTVLELTGQLAEEHGIDFHEIKGTGYEGIEVGAEIIALTNETVQPTDSITVTLEQNPFGSYRVEAHPTQAISE